MFPSHGCILLVYFCYPSWSVVMLILVFRVLVKTFFYLVLVLQVKIASWQLKFNDTILCIYVGVEKVSDLNWGSDRICQAYWKCTCLSFPGTGHWSFRYILWWQYSRHWDSILDSTPCLLLFPHHWTHYLVMFFGLVCQISTRLRATSFSPFIFWDVLSSCACSHPTAERRQ